MASVAYPSVNAVSIHDVLALSHSSVRAVVGTGRATPVVEPLSEHPNRPSRALGAVMTRVGARTVGDLG